MPKTSRRLTVHPPTLREVEVVRTVDVTPGMRRVTLAGEQLRAFTSANGFARTAFASSGFDDDIRLYFSSPGQREPVLPIQGEAKVTVPKDPRPLSKVYTVRRWDPIAGELDVDFVKHGVGTGTTWAYRAQPGDRIHFIGPRVSKALPADADWLLVAGDDTALPAIGRLLDELPSDARAQVFIEIAEDDHRQQLRELRDVEVTWLVRHGAPAGTVTLLSDAVRKAEWRPGQVFAWLAGEHTAVRDLRRHLIEDRGMPKEDIDFAVADGLHPAGVAGREMLGIYGLTEAVRTGHPSYASVTGQTFAEVRAEQGYEDRYLERLARFQPAIAEPIARSDVLTGVQHLVIHSGGAGAQAREFVAAHDSLRVTICALPAQADWLRRDLPATIPVDQQRARVSVVEQSVFEPGPAADTVFISRAFKSLPDADAAHALRRAAENLVPGGRVLLLEDTYDTDDLDEHDGEADLLALTCHGSGLRTAAELDAVITRAGLVRNATHTVGWDTTIHELVRIHAMSSYAFTTTDPSPNEEEKGSTPMRRTNP